MPIFTLMRGVLLHVIDNNMDEMTLIDHLTHAQITTRKALLLIAHGGFVFCEGYILVSIGWLRSWKSFGSFDVRFLVLAFAQLVISDKQTPWA